MEELNEQFRTMDIRLKLALLAIITAAAGYFSYTEHIDPAHLDLAAAKSEDEALGTELASLSGTGQSRVRLEAETKKADEELLGLMESLPASLDIEKILAAFANSAKETGVEMVQFLPGEGNTGTGPGATATPPPPPAPPPTPGPDGTMPRVVPTPAAISIEGNITRSALKVTILGTYPQIVAFFDRVLGMPRILRLESFRFKRQDPDSNNKLVPNPRLTVEAAFTAFTQRGGVELGLAPAPALSVDLPPLTLGTGTGGSEASVGDTAPPPAVDPNAPAPVDGSATPPLDAGNPAPTDSTFSAQPLPGGQP